MQTQRIMILAVAAFSSIVAQAANDGFDYPFGPPDGQPRCPGTAQCADGWQNVQDFRVNNHLGQDWNYGFGSDDLGRPIYAAADGQVVYAQDVGGDGSWKGVIIILHPSTHFNVPGGGAVSQVKALYGHLDPSSINNWVTVGAKVTRGQQIGVIGPTPTGSTGPHLHFEIRTNVSIGVGPGYSSDSTGWVNPSDFIDTNRPPQFTNLIVNGGFEEPRAPGGGFTMFTAPASFTGWAVESGSIDVVDTNHFASAFGLQSLDMNGNVAGGIYQDVSTSTGLVY